MELRLRVCTVATSFVFMFPAVPAAALLGISYWVTRGAAHVHLRGPGAHPAACAASAKWYAQCLRRPRGAFPAGRSAWDASFLSGRLSPP